MLLQSILVLEMETLIVPAVIAKTQSEIYTMLKKVDGKVKRLQLDVMDGGFVPNTSLNFDFKLPPHFEYEAHLMVEQPLEWIEKNANKVDIITIHIESLQNIEEAINFVKKKGAKVNLALIPKTKLEIVKPYIKKIDGILIMTVEPGSYCIKKEFKPETLQKIRQLRKLDANLPIEVDGCMNQINAKLARNAGANIFASGSYIFKSKNVDKALKELKDAVS